jgi:hypothetical protein
MQFFIVGLFVLMFYSKSRNATYVVIAAVVLLSNGIGYHVLESEPTKWVPRFLQNCSHANANLHLLTLLGPFDLNKARPTRGCVLNLRKRIVVK